MKTTQQKLETIQQQLDNIRSKLTEAQRKLALFEGATVGCLEDVDYRLEPLADLILSNQSIETWLVNKLDLELRLLHERW